MKGLPRPRQRFKTLRVLCCSLFTISGFKTAARLTEKKATTGKAP